uniref:Uncharacterized protein n=1 Tax=Ciona savignyi TaxID=51511 RepID=H2ZMX8_CIOSA
NRGNLIQPPEKPWQPNPTTRSTWQPHPTTRRPWQPNPTTRNPWRPLPTASWSTFKPWTRRTTAPRLIPSGHGGQTAWHAWVGCSATCGTGGIKYRVRYCLEPSRGCSKPHFRTQPCQQQRCSQNADRWSKWTPYGACSKTCGYGIRVRYRRCSGARCPGNPLQAAPCSSQTCSGGTIAKTSWGPWFNWGSCTRQCGSGLRVRRRSCMKGNQFGYGCRGRSGAMEQCNTHKCGSAMSADPSKTMFAWESQTVSTLCSGAESNLLWVFGDFNGDGNMDVMCGSQFGTFMIGLAMYSGGIGESSWSGNMNGCVEKPGQIAAADFNGDGKSDVICTNPTKKKTIIRFSDNGQFTGDGYEGNFCAEKGDELLVVDNDGDGKSDLICRHRSGAYDMLLNQFIG